MAPHTEPSHSTPRIHLRNLSLLELRDFVTAHHVPQYRYRQLASWLYGRLADDLAGMTDLPLAFRERLGEESMVRASKVVSVQSSAVDGTRKFLFELLDGLLVEAVQLPHGKRTTLCVSSQVGCPLDCVFCQTGMGVFGRNLTSGEILDQVCRLKAESGPDADKVNVVFMGMGEPLLNYKSLVKAIGVLNDPEGLDMGSRRVTVSTAGLVRRIRDLADERLRCSLAVSLNAASDDKRRQLMPAVSGHSIEEVLDAAAYFHNRSGRRVTLEYVLMRGVNDSRDDAVRLGRLVKGRPFKINVIPYNPGRDGRFEGVGEQDIDRFVGTLLPYAPTVTVRRSKGPDIDAACGQLWTRSLAREQGPAEESHDRR
ncbi:MAG: 23S rRNA (adenine(2503)-C(2))-methyltransferase RlmN [Candidatus Krumholzibacteriia bacterium]